MEPAGLVLGRVGGVVGMGVGFLGYGGPEVSSWCWDRPNGLSEEALGEGENAGGTRLVGLFAPILAIAGGAMSPGRPLTGAVLMVLSAAGMYWGFGFGVFTMFPIAMCLVAGIMGLAARDRFSRAQSGGARSKPASSEVAAAQTMPSFLWTSEQGPGRCTGS